MHNTDEIVNSLIYLLNTPSGKSQKQIFLKHLQRFGVSLTDISEEFRQLKHDPHLYNFLKIINAKYKDIQKITYIQMELSSINLEPKSPIALHYLKYFTSLEKLSFQNTSRRAFFTDHIDIYPILISQLYNNKELNTLQIYNGELCDVSALRFLPKLSRLDLDFSAITYLNNLNLLPCLSTLNITNCRFPDMSFLSQLSGKLDLLMVSHNNYLNWDLICNSTHTVFISEASALAIKEIEQKIDGRVKLIGCGTDFIFGASLECIKKHCKTLQDPGIQRWDR